MSVVNEKRATTAMLAEHTSPHRVEKRSCCYHTILLDATRRKTAPHSTAKKKYTLRRAEQGGCLPLSLQKPKNSCGRIIYSILARATPLHTRFAPDTSDGTAHKTYIQYTHKKHRRHTQAPLFFFVSMFLFFNRWNDVPRRVPCAPKHISVTLGLTFGVDDTGIPCSVAYASRSARP